MLAEEYALLQAEPLMTKEMCCFILKVSLTKTGFPTFQPATAKLTVPETGPPSTLGGYIVLCTGTIRPMQTEASRQNKRTTA